MKSKHRMFTKKERIRVTHSSSVEDSLDAEFGPVTQTTKWSEINKHSWQAKKKREQTI